MKNGELITDINDSRKYEGDTRNSVTREKPVVVLQEGKKGRNELFYDTIKRQILSVEEFIALIEGGQYPGYSVKVINGLSTPVSNPDNRGTNNLG